jgi:hypothetical protein
MEYPITPKMIQQAPRPAQVQDFNNFLPVYLDFKVENPINPKTCISPKLEPNPITIRPKAGHSFVETTSTHKKCANVVRTNSLKDVNGTSTPSPTFS